MLRPFQKQVFIRYLQEAGAQGDQMEAFIGTRHPPPSSADVPLLIARARRITASACCVP